MPSRTNRQVEGKMLSEYLLQEYPQFVTVNRQPLGKLVNGLAAEVGQEKAIKLSRAFRPEVDAVVVLPRHLILIEAKVWNVVNGLAKLPLYRALVATTPELQQYMPRDIIMELVVGWTNDNLETMATAMDVRVKTYNPPWLQEIVDGLHKYWTADYRRARADKLALREFYGVD